eukprot:COSAG06_NODE_6983_length_2687_cov_5.125966_2_plen_661_part_00
MEDAPPQHGSPERGSPQSSRFGSSAARQQAFHFTRSSSSSEDEDDAADGASRIPLVDEAVTPTTREEGMPEPEPEPEPSLAQVEDVPDNELTEEGAGHRARPRGETWDRIRHGLRGSAAFREALTASVASSAREESSKEHAENKAVRMAGGDRKNNSNWRNAARGVMMLQYVENRTLEKTEQTPDDKLREFAAEVFRRYDINGNGTIDEAVLSFCLKALGFQVSMTQIVKQFDKNRDGSFDIEEFQEIVSDLDKAARKLNQKNHRMEKLEKSGRIDKLQQSMMDRHGVNVSGIDLSSKDKRHHYELLNMPRYIMRDHGRPRVAWDVLQVLLLCYIAWNVPLELAQFDDAPQIPPGTPGTEWGNKVFWIEASIYVLFLLDMILSFFTTVTQGEKEIYSLTTIARIYVFGKDANNRRPGWFFVDVISLAPDAMTYIPLIADLLSGGQSVELEESPLGAVRSAKLVTKVGKFFKMLKLVRMAKTVQIFEKYGDAFTTAMTALGAFMVLFWLLHLLACVWFAVGNGIDECYRKGVCRTANQSNTIAAMNQTVCEANQTGAIWVEPCDEGEEYRYEGWVQKIGWNETMRFAWYLVRKRFAIPCVLNILSFPKTSSGTNQSDTESSWFYGQGKRNWPGAEASDLRANVRVVVFRQLHAIDRGRNRC